MENENKNNIIDVTLWNLLFDLSTKLETSIITIASLGSIIIGIGLPFSDYFVGLLINKIIIGNLNFKEFEKLVIIMIIVGICIFILSIFVYSAWYYVGKSIAGRYMTEYFRLVMKQDQTWFDNQNTHQLCSKIQSTTQAVEDGIGMNVGNVLKCLSMWIAGIVRGFTTSWELSLILCAFIPIIVFLSYSLNNSLLEDSEKRQLAYEKASGLSEEIITKFRTVTSFSNYNFERERYKNNVKFAYDVAVDKTIHTSKWIGIYYMFHILMYAFSIFFAGILIRGQFKNTISGEILKGGDVYICLSGMLYGAYSLGDSLPSIKFILQACTNCKGFYELRNRKNEIDYSKSILKPNLNKMTGGIKFKNVSFKYDGSENYIFKDFNLEIRPFTITAIVGESGTGKTTIVSLIERLYETTDGDIYIDNYKLIKIDIFYFRSLIGYVSQDPILFDTTLRENIIFGRENLTEEDILEACKNANLNFLDKMENGLDSIVSANLLSGGQKQKIAIARAIANRPKILIFDEATSSLDYESEKEVILAIKNISMNITTIIITHRTAFANESDTIIELKKGENPVIKNNVEFLIDFDKDINLNDVNLSISSEEQLLTNSKDLSLSTAIPSSLNINKKVKKNKDKNSYMENIEKKLEVIQNNKDSIKENIDLNKKNLFQILRNQKGLVTLACFSSFAVGLGWPINGYLIAQSLKAICQPFIEFQNGVRFAIIFALFSIFVGGSQFMQNYCFDKIGHYLSYKLRKLIYSKLLSMHVGFFDKTENMPGSLQSKLSSDTQNVNSIIASIIGAAIQSFSALTIGMAISFFYDWRLTLLLSCLLPFTLVSYYIYVKLNQSAYERESVKKSYTGGVISNSVTNTTTIFSYNMQVHVVTMIEEIVEVSNNKLLSQSILEGVFMALSQTLYFFTCATIFYYGGILITSKSLNSENFLPVFFTLSLATYGFSMIFKYMGQLEKSNESLNKIFEILNEKSEIEINLKESSHNLQNNQSAEEIFLLNSPIKNKPQNFTGKIEFRNVTFSYPTRMSKTVLSKVNFIIYPKQNVAFVGMTGSGKSTILHLIQRFYDINEGEILIDGINIKEYDLINLRKRMSVVEQEPVLFKMTIHENIRYGNLDSTDEEVLAAAKEANLSKEILNRFEESLHVSGGEKQRIAIARALLRKPDFVLLDEPTSALDKNNESKLQANLAKLIHGRTSLTVAHRLTTIQNCDCIYVLENSKIIEQGTHIELMKSMGKYQSLYNLQ